MFDNQDWEAAISSEVFCEYANNELRREASEEASKKTNYASELENKLDEELSILSAIEDFQKKIDASPKLREYFLKCRAALEANPELRKTVDPKFITGLEFLNLSNDGV